MRLKSFYAKTMTEAMQMVRDELGEDAIIVATREEKGGPSRGGSVRVTAAIDSPYQDDDFDDDDFGYEEYSDSRVAFEPQTASKSRSQGSRSKREWLQYDDENDNAPLIEDITDALLRHAVTEDVMDQILSCATVVGLETPGITLVAAIEHLFNFTPLPTGPHKRPMMMVGPPGSGKTLAVAKMAARGAMNGLKIGVVTCDTVRAGGIEQLQSFTNLLRIDLQKAANPQDLRNILANLRGCDQVLIDTAGINPFEKEDVKILARLIGAAEIQPFVVMPGGIDAEESGEMARVFSTIGVHTMIPTRIDMARRVGGLLSAAHQGGLSFADASNTPKVADGLVSLSPKNMAKLLMPSAFREQTPRKYQKAGRA